MRVTGLVGNLGVVLTVVAAILLLARVMEPVAPTPAPQLAAFAGWALPVWVLAGAALLVGGPRWPAVAVAAGLALQIWWALPNRHPAVADGVRLRLMTANVEYGGADADQILDLVRRHEIDVLVVQELTPGFVDKLRAGGIDAQLGHCDLHPHWTAAGTGIWSRWPLRPVGLLPSRGFTMPQVLITVPGARKVTVTGVHAIAPARGRVPSWRSDLITLADAVKATSGPRIYAGDFNASRDHSGFRSILHAGVIDAGDAAGLAPWPGFTWPTNRLGPPATRLDHVLLTPESLAVRKVQVVTVRGTDHRAVIAELGVSART
jgi:endonuclease/exonuclease/phosphatase (EEP) superfamily protein YafD